MKQEIQGEKHVSPACGLQVASYCPGVQYRTCVIPCRHFSSNFLKHGHGYFHRIARLEFVLTTVGEPREISKGSELPPRRRSVVSTKRLLDSPQNDLRNYLAKSQNRKDLDLLRSSIFNSHSLYSTSTRSLSGHTKILLLSFHSTACR